MQIKPSEVRMIAKLAAIDVANQVREQITDVVRYEAKKVLPVVEPEVIQKAPRYSACYIEPPAKPVSNYAETLMKSVIWRAKRGERLAMIWLEKFGTQETLLVEQFGDECSVLRKDESQPRSHIGAGGKLEIAGKSFWTQFDPLVGHIDQVVAKLLAKGWVVKQPTRTAVQLSLVEGMSA